MFKRKGGRGVKGVLNIVKKNCKVVKRERERGGRTSDSVDLIAPSYFCSADTAQECQLSGGLFSETEEF